MTRFTIKGIDEKKIEAEIPPQIQQMRTLDPIDPATGKPWTQAAIEADARNLVIYSEVMDFVRAAEDEESFHNPAGALLVFPSREGSNGAGIYAIGIAPAQIRDFLKDVESYMTDLAGKRG